ncbi:cytochrome b-245 chaperone 1 isoform X3 [Rhea pennata]|uniref:cytochrome b-245 chaperone 1 isoform X3 n=1 Tax=Rhea pennata TaxID=8795 RepID=UPI002E26FC8B
MVRGGGAPGSGRARASHSKRFPRGCRRAAGRLSLACWELPLKMYMLVENRTSFLLHLKRSPGIRSWSLFFGIASIGLAAAYYSADSLAWKLFYMAGCLFMAAQNLEQWEEAIFDKNKGTICLKTFNLYKKILTLSRGGNEQVVALLHEIRDVNVEEETVRYFGKGYLVVLRFVTGFSHPLTQSAVLGCRRCCVDFFSFFFIVIYK